MKEKKNQNKQQQGTSQTATAVDPGQEQPTSRPEKLDNKNQSSSTPKSKQRSKLKCIDSQTPPEDIVDTFHNRNLAPSEWEKYADQLLKRGVQRVADEIRGNPQQISEKDTTFEPPQGISDESSTEEQTKLQANEKQGTETLWRPDKALNKRDIRKPNRRSTSEESTSGIYKSIKRLQGTKR